ncbi:limonene-1,2-epoxide hydrolase family protein [Rhodococcus globerulus]|uniref:Limonene-1,2-epoxide hydrolase family protein n=1 Tax=Rhodococcus globerulus TaxID=33008 RepID=A0ABU4C4I2_RHOGO|nr:limonene-1,2-epoxide hydrolase family protein [Rhodococcus globerulus]MDV6271415.1 limonene-1,2-epoxide hydrolase family protein [Rhodococcus globerulus]
MTNIGPNSRRLLDFWDKWDSNYDSFVDSFRDVFTDETIWWNTESLPEVKGLDEAIEKILQPSKDSPLGMECIRVEVLHITESANIVFHERIDHLLRADRSIILSTPIAGITEFDANGKITHWREYNDPTRLLAMMAETTAP